MIKSNAINFESKLPLYHQLHEILHDQITSGKWEKGEQIPSEAEIMSLYEVSRITVRQALDMLVKEGLVSRRRGKGSFVAQTSLEHSLTRIVSFTEDMTQRGLKASTEVLFSGIVFPDKHISDKLNIDKQTELVEFERLRLANNEPMCFERSYLIHKYVKNILDFDFSKRSLREVKSQHYNVKWKKAKQTIQALNATEKIANILGIKKNAAVLFFERVSFSQDNIPVEFLQVYYRADRYTLYNELQSGAG